MMIRLSVLLAPETLMRWRVLCDSGQVTSQVTRKSFAHQHSFAVLACVTFFWDVFCVVYIFMCAHILVILLSLCCFLFLICFSFISLSTCQSLIYVRHSSAFFFLVVCLCVAGWCQLQFSLLLAQHLVDLYCRKSRGSRPFICLFSISFFSVSFSFLNASAWLRLNSGARRISFFNKGRQERKKWAEKQVN